MYATVAPAPEKKKRGRDEEDDKQQDKAQKVDRPVRVRKVRLGESESYFVKPAYKTWTPYGGGTGVVATLTYRAVDPTNYGSGPQRGHCLCVNALNQEGYKGVVWVAGHLLNDNLGGPGLSWNLTPMTSWRNRTFNGDFEQPIKAALIKSRQLDNTGAVDVWYGIKLTVFAGACAAVDGSKAAKAVRQRVTYGARWVSVTKAVKASDRVITLLTRAAPDPALDDLPVDGYFDPGETNPDE